MANIVLAMHRISKDPILPNSMPPYYEGLIRGLKNSGNNVLCFFHDIHGMQWDNKTLPDFVKNKLEKFSPDVFLLLNYDFFDCSDWCDVPMVIYDVDSPNLYRNKTAINRHPERYKFLTIQKAGIDLIKDSYQVNDSAITYIRAFTEINSKTCDKSVSRNIAFCGSHWLWSGCTPVYKFMKKQPDSLERKMAFTVLKEYQENPFGTLDEIYNKLGYYPDRKLNNNNSLLAGRLSGLKRAQYLTSISDLGLEIRGEYWNHPSLNYFPEIALCYNKEPTVTLYQNENFYNTSKIGFNINHIQAKTGFSWRVCDILASSACLVSEYTSDLEANFGNLGIPIYHSKEEARELCIKLLENEKQRKEIVDASNKLIDKEYRFINALSDLELACQNISLRTNEPGTVEYINLTPYLNSLNKTAQKKLTLLNRIERKIWSLLSNDLKKRGVI